MRESLKRIIEPLASRCSKFRFKSLDSTSTMKRVEMIAEAENVQIDDRVSFDLDLG
jgi:replication factor C subunit 2/4